MEETTQKLALPSLVQMKEELIVTTDSGNQVTLNDEQKQIADSWIENVFSIGNRDLDSQTAITQEVKSLGSDTELVLTEQSKLLQAPMSELMADAENGSDVAKDLLRLEEVARDIDPNGYDFSTLSGFRQFLSMIGFPTPLSRWIVKYQSTESIIKSIETGLTQGKDKLKRDNITLKDDQVRYRKTLYILDDRIEFARYLDQEFEKRLGSVTDEEQKRFLKDEVLFPAKQRVQDLLTSKGVYQQAWVTSEFIIKTNEELIRGVTRALQHTMVALGVASSLAIALARQKRVIVALESSKAITEKMITDVSERLLAQGASIMAQASEPYIQIEVMKNVFAKTIEAMDAVSTYRSDAIESMKDGIKEMKTATDEMDKNIQRVEKGHAVREELKLTLS